MLEPGTEQSQLTFGTNDGLRIIDLDELIVPNSSRILLLFIMGGKVQSSSRCPSSGTQSVVSPSILGA
jgi:hypothetical protein